jgi:hypothetical protein
MLLRSLLLGLALSGFAAPAIDAAAAREPLLMEGKKTLHQRVLTRPGAVLKRSPGDGPGAQQPALTRLYVYDRQVVAGAEWLEVGLTAKGETDGWVAAEFTLPWKQQLALAFTNPANRERTLMFGSRDDLQELIDAPEPAEAVAPIRAAVESGAGDPRVVSIEPATYVDVKDRFYLLPILQAEETFTGTGHRVRVLEIASVSARDEEAGTPSATGEEGAAPRASLLRNFKAAVVFVIDSTISMGPYIDRTRAAVNAVYEKIDSSGLSGQVKFGMVAFRSNVEATPGLEYTSRTFANPVEVADGADFLRKVSDLKEATVSSARFSEDSYAGVMEALSGIDWAEFGGRYVILVTDAGALRGNDPLSGTGLDAEQVRAEAAYRGVALYTLHLKTPAGGRNHAEAEAQYRALSTHPLLANPLYYPVDAGSVDDFGTMVDALADALVANVQAAYSGEEVAGSARTADPAFSGAARQEPAPAEQDTRERMRRDAEMLGHAMQLAYLGRTAGTRAPPLFSAWISDRDLARPEVATTEVRVLLTKNQLSDMQQVLQTIAETAEAARFEPDEFYDQMKSVAAVLGRDPNAINDADATRLADLGLMGEYLDDLPYQSKVLQLDQATWTAWSIGQQQAFIDEINRKLRLYQVIHDDVDRWVALDGGADPGEAVYPVPLDLLP